MFPSSLCVGQGGDLTRASVIFNTFTNSYLVKYPSLLGKVKWLNPFLTLKSTREDGGEDKKLSFTPTASSFVRDLYFELAIICGLN